VSLLTLEDVAKRCGLSRRTIEREIDRGHLHALRVGERGVRVREVEYDRWLEIRSGGASTLRGTQPKED